MNTPKFYKKTDCIKAGKFSLNDFDENDFVNYTAAALILKTNTNTINFNIKAGNLKAKSLVGRYRFIKIADLKTYYENGYLKRQNENTKIDFYYTLPICKAMGKNSLKDFKDNDLITASAVANILGMGLYTLRPILKTYKIKPLKVGKNISLLKISEIKNAIYTIKWNLKKENENENKFFTMREARLLNMENLNCFKDTDFLSANLCGRFISYKPWDMTRAFERGELKPTVKKCGSGTPAKYIQVSDLKDFIKKRAIKYNKNKKSENTKWLEIANLAGIKLFDNLPPPAQKPEAILTLTDFDNADFLKLETAQKLTGIAVDKMAAMAVGGKIRVGVLKNAYNATI